MEIKDVHTSDLLLHIKICLDEVEKRRMESNEKLQYFDKKVSDIYHEIETTNFNAQIGWRLTKNLQEKLRMRRVVKNEQWIFNAIYKNSRDNSSREWKQYIDYIESIIKTSSTTPCKIKQQDEWSNVAKLGKIKYREVEAESDKRFGKVEDKLLELKNRMQQGAR